MTGECLNPCIWVVRTVFAAASLLMAAVDPSVAESFEDGLAAFHREDYAAAMRIFRQLAEKGHVDAQFYLGHMYESGLGARQSSLQAAIWFRKAAEQGDAVSQSSLGTMYFLGDGVPQNYAEAMKWSLMAAKQGDASAQSGLGMFYKWGYGVPQNYILAYMWYSVAAHDPDYEPVAKKDQNKLAPHMAPSQIAEAQSLARQCVESRYEDCPPTHDKVASSARRSPSQTRVPLKMSGGTFLAPVKINGTMTLDFIIDSGASDVSVPADVFSTLNRTGTVKESDIVGQRTYVLADGSKTQGITFVIRSLGVGDVTIENVTASVAPPQGNLLLGQSFLKRFKSWSIDNTAQGLLLETR